MNKKNNIGFVGLGKLGSCMVACLADADFNLFVHDINADNVIDIIKGVPPKGVREPNLPELLFENRNRIHDATCKTIIEETSSCFICVLTPSKIDSSFSIKHLKDSLKDLSVELKNSKKKYYNFFIISTVSPGAIELELIPFIEKHSGRTFNQDFGLCYTPWFIALGTTVNDFKNPNLITIGSNKKEDGDLLESMYKKMIKNHPEIYRLSIVEAEIAKLGANTFSAVKLSLANLLSNICEEFDGANVDRVNAAITGDKRFSPLFFKGGMSFGGPCLPRDLKAFSRLCKSVGLESSLSEAAEDINQDQIFRLFESIKSFSDFERKKIVIMGLSYKPGASYVFESPSMWLIDLLLEEDYEVIVYDPPTYEFAREILKNKVQYAENISECFKDDCYCVIAVKDNKFTHLQGIKPGSAIFDCWRIIDQKDVPNNVDVISIGQGHYTYT